MRCLVKVCGVGFIYDLFSAIEYNDNTIKIRPNNCDWDIYVTDVTDVKKELDNLVKTGYADFSQYKSMYQDMHYDYRPQNGGNREMEFNDALEVDLDEIFRE